MVAKYGQIFERDPKAMHMSYGIGIWEAILKGEGTFWRFIMFRLGSGEEIIFWKDDPLKEEFNEIYNLVININKQETIIDNYDG